MNDKLKIILPEPGWLVVLNAYWWENWRQIMGQMPEEHGRIRGQYRYGETDFTDEDQKLEPFLVVSVETGQCYVSTVGYCNNVDVKFLVGDKIKHIFAEAGQDDMLNNIFWRVH